MKSHWIDYKGKRILYIDYSGWGNDLSGLKTEMNAVIEAIAQRPEKSILGLTDVRGTTFSTEMVQLIKNSGNVIGKHFVPKKHAIIGITGIRMIIYQAISKAVGEAPKLFDTVEEAEDWLVSPD
jgi:hypothetical protein